MRDLLETLEEEMESVQRAARIQRLDQEEEARAFSYQQLAVIARLEKQCSDAGCDDNGHKCV